MFSTYNGISISQAPQRSVELPLRVEELDPPIVVRSSRKRHERPKKYRHEQDCFCKKCSARVAKESPVQEDKPGKWSATYWSEERKCSYQCRQLPNGSWEYRYPEYETPAKNWDALPTNSWSSSSSSGADAAAVEQEDDHVYTQVESPTNYTTTPATTSAPISYGWGDATQPQRPHQPIPNYSQAEETYYPDEVPQRHKSVKHRRRESLSMPSNSKPSLGERFFFPGLSRQMERSRNRVSKWVRDVEFDEDMIGQGGDLSNYPSSGLYNYA